jgi:hypothetical protein
MRQEDDYGDESVTRGQGDNLEDECIGINLSHFQGFGDPGVGEMAHSSVRRHFQVIHGGRP